MERGIFYLKGHTFGDSVIQVDKPNTTTLASHACPFGLASFFHLIYFQSRIVLVKYFVDNETAGIYYVAFTIMVAVYLLPTVIYQKFLLPKMHRWANHDRNKFYEVYRRGNIAMLFLGVFIMILLWLLAPIFVPFIFGTQYADAVILLNVLSLCAPIVFIAFSAGATLVTQDHMKKKVKYMGFVAIINIFLGLILIPIYGAIGAAISTVVSNLILLIIYYIAAQKIVFSLEVNA
jgi:O-antigen/teichoic acid export membrane protein